MAAVNDQTHSRRLPVFRVGLWEILKRRSQPLCRFSVCFVTTTARKANDCPLGNDRLRCCEDCQYNIQLILPSILYRKSVRFANFSDSRFTFPCVLLQYANFTSPCQIFTENWNGAEQALQKDVQSSLSFSLQQVSEPLLAFFIGAASQKFQPPSWSAARSGHSLIIAWLADWYILICFSGRAKRDFAVASINRQ